MPNLNPNGDRERLVIIDPRGIDVSNNRKWSCEDPNTRIVLCADLPANTEIVFRAATGEDLALTIELGNLINLVRAARITDQNIERMIADLRVNPNARLSER